MSLSEFTNTDIDGLIGVIKEQQDEVFNKMLAVGIEKGIISVRTSSPVLIKDKLTDKIVLKQSAVIDYLGAEKIEELENENAYLKKMNSELHAALTDFYEKTKVNTWLKNT